MIRLLYISSVAVAMLVTACNRAPSAVVTKPEAAKPAQTGVASFYGSELAGQETASGEPLKLDAMTAASRTLPIGTRVQVVNVETGQSTKVRINDRGPYAEGRILDLTPKAARYIGIDRRSGVARVSVKPIQTGEPPTPSPAFDKKMR